MDIQHQINKIKRIGTYLKNNNNHAAQLKGR